MTENVQEKVVEAYHIAAKGSFDHARMILEETLYDFPNSIEAWLLLADLAEDSEEARQCYQMVLEINPNNWVAQQRLKVLFSNSEPAMVSTVPLPEDYVQKLEQEPEQTNGEEMIPESFLDELMADQGEDNGKTPTLKESFETHRKLVLGVGGGVLALLVLGAIAWVVSVGYIAWKMGFFVLTGA